MLSEQQFANVQKRKLPSLNFSPGCLKVVDTFRAAFEMGEAVGRPAALRRLLAEIEEDHTDEIAAWALAAPDPAERASFCQQEVGRRRRGPPRAKYEHLSRDEQQRIALRALARIRDEARRRDKVALMHDTTAKSEDDR